MTQVLVTGGAGFIGSHLVRALLQQGASVRVLDNFSTGRRENLLPRSRALEVLEGDVRDAPWLAEAVHGVEFIYHEAAFVSVPESMEKPQLCFDVNITGTAMLLEAARRSGVRRVVIASSAAVYGDSPELPLREATGLRTLSPYALSKQADELLGDLYTRSFGLEVVSLRYFNVYGPRQRPDSMYAAAVPIFISRMRANLPVTVFGDGLQTRDLIYVGDVVRANLLAAEHPAAAGQVFNVCTGRQTRILDLLEALKAVFPGSPAPVFGEPRPGDIHQSFGSPELARAVLGFEPGTSLADGLKETAQWL